VQERIHLDLNAINGVSNAVDRVADDPIAPLYASRLQCSDQYIRHSFAHRLDLNASNAFGATISPMGDRYRVANLTSVCGTRLRKR
jgi:hypothetical protein